MAFVVGMNLVTSADSASPSGTSIPIKKGGTGATTPSDAIQNLLPDFASNAGKVLGSTGSGIGWVAQAGGGGYFVSPDYANRGTTDLFDSLQWTADKIGFVTVGGSAINGGQNQVTLYVNNKIVENSRASGSTNVHATWTIPVKVGDMVKLQINGTATETFCNFVPPIYSTPPTPIVVEGGDYSTSEQAVMVNDGGNLRAKLWMDRRPIYQKTIPWTTAATAIGDSQNIVTISGIGTIVDATVKNASGTSAAMVILSGDTVVLRNEMTTQISAGVQWYITIQYTKATDTPL
ncbi:MAG: hypothetical protein LBK50_02960 [Candidatus Nomurabacteria bacterium]|nr:hypothetical protein [Candidatus Nomurabacteria bacterium]